MNFLELHNPFPLQFRGTLSAFGADENDASVC